MLRRASAVAGALVSSYSLRSLHASKIHEQQATSLVAVARAGGQQLASGGVGGELSPAYRPLQRDTITADLGASARLRGGDSDGSRRRWLWSGPARILDGRAHASDWMGEVRARVNEVRY